MDLPESQIADVSSVALFFFPLMVLSWGFLAYEVLAPIALFFAAA
jgi:hypothetical protein